MGLLGVLAACAGPVVPGRPEPSHAVATDLPWAEPLPSTDRVFVVAPGETLSLIAARLEVPVAELVELNGLADPDRLEVGQELLVPWRIPARLLPEPGPRARTPPTPTPPTEVVSREESPDVESPSQEQALRRLRIDLELARSAYHGADFEGALSITQYLSSAALALAPLPAATRLGSEASFLRGAIRVGLGDADGATCDFAEALALSNGYEPNLSEISPKVLAVFRSTEALGPSALAACVVPEGSEGASASLGARRPPSTKDRP